jgi:hypothetical protein
MENNLSQNNNNTQNISNSLSHFNSKSFEEYKEWLDKNIKLNKFSTIFYFMHVRNFLYKHGSSLGYEKFYYIEKYFYYSLELKLVDLARRIFFEIASQFGREPKIQRLEAMLKEAEGKDVKLPANIYTNLFQYNQDDRQSLKKYLMLFKVINKFDNMKEYIDNWNEYLKVYMDDYDAWYELSDVYILTNNHAKAVYCLEEILLHQPNNYKIYIKIGDIQSGLNHSEAAGSAIKYYSKSILIKPTPRAFWGIIYSLNILARANKTLDPKMKNLLKIAKIQLENFYSKSPFKINVDKFYDIKVIDDGK